MKTYTRDKQVITFNIGTPPKPHRFDIVIDDRTVVIECKCITWTETGNVPSGKIKSINEAVFFLSFVTDADTYVVIKKSESAHRKQNESLADYYFRINQHLLRRTKILEYDDVNDVMRKIGW